MFKFYIKIYIGSILNTYCLIAKNNSTEIFIFLNYLWVKVLRVFMFLYRLYWGWKKWGSIVTLTNISISQFFLGQLLEYQRFHFPTLDLRIWNSPSWDHLKWCPKMKGFDPHPAFTLERVWLKPNPLWRVLMGCIQLWQASADFKDP